LKQKIIKKILKQKDQHDLNREESVLSVEIIHSLQSALSEMLGYEFKIIEGNKRNDPNSSSIHVALTQSEVDKTRDENEDLAEIGIGSIELSRELIAELFGQNNQILSAFSYPGDGHLAPQYHINAQKLLRDFGQKSLEPVVVTRIFLCNENEAAKIAGVEIEEDGEKRFISADSLHISAGYMAKLQVVGSAKEATSNPTTVATGVSTNIILQRNFVVNNFIRYFGHTAELAVTNSHWTMLAKNDSYVIMRVTGGGNTGSESYNPNYFLNNIANTLRIYGGGEDEISPLVAIVRTYGCPRSINAINSTSLEKLGINFLTSYGKGGTGNTKRFFEAVVALCELGNEEEVLSYFSQFQTSEGINLGDKIDKVLQEFRADKDFFQDSVESISKEIGYKKFSGLMGTLLRRNNYIC